MFGKEKEARITTKPQILTLKWYPSSRCFSSTKRHKSRPNLMPPLMVRKPEWRR